MGFGEIRATSHRLRELADPIGDLLTEAFHFIGLFAIGGATVWAAIHAFLGMIGKGHASIEDLLLLFIYLEIGSMVGIYFKTNRMPVRFLVYVGITALTRHLIGYINHEPKPDMGILIMAGGTLIMAISVLVLRYTSVRFPAPEAAESTRSDHTATD